MASSSSSSPSALALSSQLWQYHVFLSFRGEDTRKNFVDHLYTALEQLGIYSYKDDETLPRGESIGPSLEKAIEESQIAVIIFSKNYADSVWCLDELVHIMKCKDTRGQIVMPIFYDVDPSLVWKQKQKYGEALAKHELENKAKAESWRKALVDASNISGWEPQHIANGHESKCIKKIVDTISHRLHPLSLSVDDNLVGVEARMQDLISMLQIGFSGKIMFGIWGYGGGGKTTLACSIYDEISSEFDGCCFLKNIREESSKRNGLERLQEKIICGVLKQKQVEVGRVEEGRHMIKDRLHHRKVLIVLDDVNNLEHLEELAGSHDWFGEGSRIIITTRDEHVLTAHKVDVIHNIRLLSDDEAMKLFCKHSPRGDRRMEDYEQLSKDVVSYAGGLPLALRVLNRFLCDKDMDEWRSALARLKEIPDAKILEKIKITFDGLTLLERELFLDIACFFRGRYKDEESMMILDACGFHPVIGIKNLDKIEAIDSQRFRSDELQRILQVAANMNKLRWIDLEDSARLVATALPLIMPEKFPPKELFCLTLHRLNVKQLWEGYKYLPNLRLISLHHLRKLINTPDFYGLPNLERFMIGDFPLLEEIHPSFGRLEKLVCVQIQGCESLKKVPPITRSKKLKTLSLSGCSAFNNLSKIQQSIENYLPHNMNHIGEWFFSGCLRKLDLRWCNLVDGDIRSGAVWELPNLHVLHLTGNKFSRLNFGLLRLPRLKCLNVSYCYDLVELSELPSSIAVVIADDCKSLESFGDISNCKWLWKVSLGGPNKLGPHGCDILLDSMLEGNAENYFISIRISGIDIWRGLPVPWFDWVDNCNMWLPHDWYVRFSGILMFVRAEDLFLDIKISMKQGIDEDFQSHLWNKSNDSLKNHNPDTYVGYVSFSSLRHTGCLNSTYNVISFSYDEHLYVDGRWFGAVLLPKGDRMQTTKFITDSSEFGNEEEVYERKTFYIQHDSNSCIKILWNPFSHF